MYNNTVCGYKVSDGDPHILASFEF